MKNTNDNIDSNLPIVGIDLGTTNSSAAYIGSNKKPQIIPSFKGEHLIPSVILIDTGGNVVVGKDAKDAIIAMPDRTLAAVKRKMGQSIELTIADKTLLPQEASALILKEIKNYVDAVLGEGKKEAVITVPAYFTDEQRKATKQAGEIAGFVVERIINEPTAAALAYGLNNLKKDACILVYDLGGGTFDVSVVEMMKGLLEVNASTGNSQLGGEDFDWKIVDFFADYMMQNYKIDPRNNIQAKSILKAEAERVKMLLSLEETVNVSIPIVMMQNQKPLGIFTEITRSQFEKMIEDMLNETIDSVKKVIDDANLKASDIDHILLVGGSTRIPFVSRLLEEYFNKKPKNEIDPDEAVALGAAVQAGIKAGTLGKKSLVATDVAPFSMGVAVLKDWSHFRLKPGGFHAIIPRNTTIPITKSEQFRTCADGQTTVCIEVYQGEEEWVKNNHKLGEFLLEGIPPNMAGAEEINVTFTYNLNGILEVTAKSESTGEQISVNIQDKFNRDSMESFLESVSKIENILDTQNEVIYSEEEDYDEEDYDDEDFDDEDFDDEEFDDEDFDPLDDSEVSADKLMNELQSLSSELTTSAFLVKKDNRRLENKLKRANKIIEEAMVTKDKDALLGAIDEVMDILIELKLE